MTVVSGVGLEVRHFGEVVVNSCLGFWYVVFSSCDQKIIAQLLGALFALLEDLGLVPSTCMALNCL